MHELLCVSNVARQLSVSKKRVYQLINEGRLDSLRPGLRTIRITRDSLERFIEGGIREERKNLGLDMAPKGVRNPTRS